MGNNDTAAATSQGQSFTLAHKVSGVGTARSHIKSLALGRPDHVVKKCLFYANLDHMTSSLRNARSLTSQGRSLTSQGRSLTLMTLDFK
ncbi:hypothetical protein J6590_093140, partial [Homalodisca vitripennis]